jgi:hypothetical protein
MDVGLTDECLFLVNLNAFVVVCVHGHFCIRSLSWKLSVENAGQNSFMIVAEYTDMDTDMDTDTDTDIVIDMNMYMDMD